MAEVDHNAPMSKSLSFGHSVFQGDVPAGLVPARRPWSGVAAGVIWLAAGLSAGYWALQAWGRSPVTPLASATVSLPVVDTNSVSQALGATAAPVVGDAGPAVPVATRYDLIGVVSDRRQQGAALMVAIKPHLGQVGNWLLARSAQIGGGVLELSLSLVFVFFFYRDGPRLAAFVLRLLQRLIGERAEYYLELVAGTVQRVVNGVIGTAAAQGLLAMIGFLIAGVPGAIVLGLVTFMLSLIPMGPPLAWLPATAWLVWQGHYGMAVFLGIWGTFVISGVDNVLKPYLISRGGNLPLVIVLLGVFGGLLAFGFIGLFIGPTLLAVGYSLLLDWSRNAAQQPPQQ